MARKDPEGRARTRQRIVDGSWSLVSGAGDKRITASSVIEAAGVNRSTFYDHFDNINEVSRAFEDDLIGFLGQRASMVAASPEGAVDLTGIYEMLDEKGDRFRYLICGNGSAHFMEEAKALLKPLMASIAGDQMDDTEKAYRIEFAASGLLAFFALWHRSGQSDSLEKATVLLRDLVLECLDSSIC